MHLYHYSVSQKLNTSLFVHTQLIAASFRLPADSPQYSMNKNGIFSAKAIASPSGGELSVALIRN